MNKYPLTFLAILCGAIIICSGCKKKDDNSGGITDAQLYKLSTTSGHTYYKNSTDYLPVSGGSPHNKFVRVKFNQKAQSVLGTDGKLPSGNSFPDSSLVVKETYDVSGGALKLYVSMMKLSGDGNNGKNWVWAEYQNDGKVEYSIQKKGSSCTGCHSGTPNRDHVKIFDLN